MKIETVIGANYGDEGKGQTTYEICRKYGRPIVVLTNGGCQRGHTVEYPGFGMYFIISVQGRRLEFRLIFQTRILSIRWNSAANSMNYAGTVSNLSSI